MRPIVADSDVAQADAESFDQSLANLLEQVTRRLGEGGSVDVEELASAYPHHADRLRELMPTMTAMATWGRSPASEPNEGSPPSCISSMSGVLGDFRIVRELGRGGMGTVFEAEQVSMGRRVALKVLPYAALAHDKALQRFRNEVRAAAALDHPHIVSVYSVGEERGIHYYSMQLVRGQTLADVILQARTHRGNAAHNSASPAIFDRGAPGNEALTIASNIAATPSTHRDEQARISTAVDSRPPAERYRAAARHGIQAAEALQHAHDQGVLHRDIKPGNLMLDADGELYVTDFGLARIQTDAGMTMTGDIVGTLRYMAPEQALAKRVVIDHRTDVYSLGATLYEYLTLEPAFAVSDRSELLKRIAFEEPMRLRKLDRHIPMDLETIVLKAMAKSPDERYQTAQGLADDLHAFFDHLPIKAKPPTLVSHVSKWSRRHVGVVWTALAGLLMVTTVCVLGAMQLAQSRNDAVKLRLVAEEERRGALDERKTAIRERSLARRNQYFAEMVSGQVKAARESFAGLYDDLIQYLPLAGDQDYRDWEWYYLMANCRQERLSLRSPSPSNSVAWSPDGKYLATPGSIWEAESQRWIRLFSTSRMGRRQVAWSPDGSRLAWGTSEDENAIYVYNRREESVSRYGGFPSSVASLAWSPDGTLLAGGSPDGALKVWEVASNSVVWNTVAKTQALSLSWSPDGRYLAAGQQWAGVVVWDFAKREAVYEAPSSSKECAVSWKPDGSKLAVCTADHWFLLDRGSWNESHRQEIANGSGIQYSPNGSRLAIIEGRRLRICTADGGETIEVLNGHRRRLTSVSWHPDGIQLATADDQGNVLLWTTGSHREQTQISTGSAVANLAWVENDSAIHTYSDASGASSTWDVTTTRAIRREHLAVEEEALVNPLRRLRARKVSGRAVEVLNALNGSLVKRIELEMERDLHSWTLSDDGTYLMTQSHQDNVLYMEIWDIDRGKLVSSIRREGLPLRTGGYSVPVYKVLSWPAGSRRFAVAGMGKRNDSGSTIWLDNMYVFDVDSGAEVYRRIPRNRDFIASAAWDDEHQVLACGTELGELQIISLDPGRSSMSSEIHRYGICALAWHPGGERLAASSVDGDVLIVSAEGAVLLTFATGRKGIKQLAWSSDGQRLAAGSADGVVTIWDASASHNLDDPAKRPTELVLDYMALAERHGLDNKVRDRLLELIQDDLGSWHDRGMLRAASGGFQEAAAEFAKITMVQPNLEHSFEPAYQQAVALLGAKHMDRYRQVSRDLLAIGLKSPVPSNSGYAAWLCSLAPNPLIASNSAVDAAKVFLTNEQRHRHKDAFARIVLGAALHRDGQYAEAIDELARAAAACESKSESYVDGTDTHMDWMWSLSEFLSTMALHKLGEEFQARRHLEAAQNRADAFNKRTPAADWQRLVPLRALRQEAEAMIDGARE